MKILHISRTMGQGGAEKVVYQLCKLNDGNEKYVASTGGYYEEELKKLGVKHYKILDIDNHNPLSALKIIASLNKIIKHEGIDVIHTHHRMAAFYGQLLLVMNKNIKLIYTAHNIFENKKELLRFSLRNTKIIAVGDGVKKNLEEFYRIDGNKISVVYNSIDAVTTGNKNKEIAKLKNDGKIVIGTIGRLSEQKGMDIFLRGIADVIRKNNNVYAIVVGDGENKEKLLQLTQELNIVENVRFLGYQKNVLDIIEQLDFVVLSSRWEGFPLTPIEVFSRGKTIIVSNISGNNEIVDDMRNGLMFEKGSIDELSEKITYLIDHDSMRKKFEKEAYKDFVQKYSYQEFENAYKNIYSKLL